MSKRNGINDENWYSNGKHTIQVEPGNNKLVADLLDTKKKRFKYTVIKSRNKHIIKINIDYVVQESLRQAAGKQLGWNLAIFRWSFDVKDEL